MREKSKSLKVIYFVYCFDENILYTTCIILLLMLLNTLNYIYTIII